VVLKVMKRHGWKTPLMTHAYLENLLAISRVWPADLLLALGWLQPLSQQ
jgi:hypothetical protein